MWGEGEALRPTCHALSWGKGMTAGALEYLRRVSVYRRLSAPPLLKLPNFDFRTHSDYRHVFADSSALPELDRNGDSPLPVKLAFPGQGKELSLSVACALGQVVELQHSLYLRLPCIGREEMQTRLGSLGERTAFGSEDSELVWNSQAALRIERVIKGACEKPHRFRSNPPDNPER